MIRAANWPPDERDRLYQTYAYRLKEQGRYGDLVNWMKEWIKLEPTESDTYEMLLAALIYTDRQAEADELISGWIRESLADPPLAEAARARRDAAIETVTGDNSYLRGGDTDPRWFELLAEVVLTYVERDDAEQHRLEHLSGFRKPAERPLPGRRPQAARPAEGARRRPAARRGWRTWSTGSFRTRPMTAKFPTTIGN